MAAETWHVFHLLLRCHAVMNLEISLSTYQLASYDQPLTKSRMEILRCPPLSAKSNPSLHGLACYNCNTNLQASRILKQQTPRHHPD